MIVWNCMFTQSNTVSCASMSLKVNNLFSTKQVHRVEENMFTLSMCVKGHCVTP